MKKIAIITDSASDISFETAEKYNIKIIPLRICFSDRTFRDRTEITPVELYDRLKNEIPKSSLPAAEDVISAFDRVKEEGYEQALYVGISSGLSGTYNFVKLMGEDYEGLELRCFDTKSLSCGEGMLVEVAAKMIADGASIEETVEELCKIRQRTFASFVVKDLTYLSRGGRIGKVAGTLGSLLKICPIVRVNEDGVYETSGKSMGFSRSLQMMIKQVEEKFSGMKIAVSVVHGLEELTARSVMNKIKKFASVAYEAVMPVTAVLGVHTGPGLIGIVAYET